MTYLFARVALIGKCWPDVYSDGSWDKLRMDITRLLQVICHDFFVWLSFLQSIRSHILNNIVVVRQFRYLSFSHFYGHKCWWVTVPFHRSFNTVFRKVVLRGNKLPVYKNQAVLQPVKPRGGSTKDSRPSCQELVQLWQRWLCRRIKKWLYLTRFDDLLTTIYSSIAVKFNIKGEFNQSSNYW